MAFGCTCAQDVADTDIAVSQCPTRGVPLCASSFAWDRPCWSRLKLLTEVEDKLEMKDAAAADGSRTEAVIGDEPGVDANGYTQWKEHQPRGRCSLVCCSGLTNGFAFPTKERA